MSHSKLRKETNCLNCGAQVTGRYCNQCGQENIEPEPSLWHLVVHFFNDFTHFDGKFFSTIKLLLLKPGFLSAEYKKGRRAAYLDPIRMYIFTSAIAFLLFFWMLSGLFETKTPAKNKQTTQINDTSSLRNSEAYKEIQRTIDADTNSAKDEEFEAQTVAQYDSLQKALPPAKRDDVFSRYMNRRGVAVAEHLDDPENSSQFAKDIIYKFLHSFPQLLFVSLPFFALILYLLNIRRRKNYLFVSHVIFTVHFYCASFILLIISLALIKIPYVSFLAVLTSVILPWAYLLVAMRKFYGQGWGKTIIKFIALNALSSIVILTLFVIYLVYSAFSVSGV